MQTMEESSIKILLLIVLIALFVFILTRKKK